MTAESQAPQKKRGLLIGLVAGAFALGAVGAGALLVNIAERTQETSPPWAIESTRSAWQRRQFASTTAELSGRARMTSGKPPSVKASEWCQPLRALTAYLETGPAGV